MAVVIVRYETDAVAFRGLFQFRPEHVGQQAGIAECPDRQPFDEGGAVFAPDGVVVKSALARRARFDEAGPPDVDARVKEPFAEAMEQAALGHEIAPPP
jgi:hypothetical protein